MADTIEWHPNGTPGPWVAIDYDKGGDIVELKGLDLVASAFHCGYTRNGYADEERCQTNARAIAEVPAMVQALRGIVTLCHDMHPDLWPHPLRDAQSILARIDAKD